MENRINRCWLVITLVLLGVIVSACGKSPLRSAKNVQLEEAKRQYAEASRDADIVRGASPQLDLARDALEMAEARKIKNTNAHIAHYVYLFDQHMRMAQLAVEQKRIQDKLDARAQKTQQGAVMETLVKAEGAETELGENSWDLLLAAANATDASDTADAAPNKSPSVATAAETDRGKIMTLGDVLFDVNKTTLAGGAEQMIKNLVVFLNENSTQMAVIEGHTDNTGDSERNRALSRDRAITVQEALVEAGIAAHRLAVRGVGESAPVASNESESGRRLNRRVDVILLN